MKRVLTALALIPFILFVIFWGPSWLFLAVVVTVAALCFYEYSGIVEGHGIARPGPAGYAAGLLFLLVQRNEVLLIVLVTLLIAALSLRKTELSKCLPYAAALMFGVLYAFGPWRSALALRSVDPLWLFLPLLVSWTGDTGAYYVGRVIGRHRLAPRISPAKSWEGAVASVITAAAVGTLYCAYLLPSVPLIGAVGLTAVTNVAGQIGDLAESAMKRGAGVKDSGTTLPGHGGWLDRVDSALFAIPVVHFYLWRGQF